MYCSIDDLKDAIPEQNIEWLTDDEDSGSVNTARANAAITDASELIDGYLRGRYTLPMSPTPAIVQRLCVDISIYYLYQRIFETDMPGAMNDRYKNAVKILEGLQQGKISFATSQDDDAAPPQIRVNKIADDRLFTMDKMNF